MTAKEYLNQAYWLDRRIDSLLERQSALKAMTTKATAVLSDESVSHSRNVHRAEDLIAGIIDMEEEINAEIDRLVALKAEIAHVIMAVQDPETRVLLEMRYLCFKSWKQVAEILGYHVRTVYRLHERATEQIQRILDA